MRDIIVLVFLFGSYLSLQADESSEWFRAYEHYNNANYEDALEQFELIIDQSQDQDTLIAAYFGLIKCYIKTSESEQATKMVTKAYKLIESDFQRAQLLTLEGFVWFDKGNYQKSYEVNAKATEILGNNSEYKEDLAQAHQSMAKSLLWLSKPEKADSCNQIALNWLSPEPQKYPLVYGRIINVNGIIDYFNGDFDLAIEDFEESVRQKLKIYDKHHPEIGSLYGNIGVMYNHLLQYDRALEYFSQDLDLTSQRLGEDHPKVAITHTNIGIAYKKMGLFEKAKKAHLKALDIRISLGEDHPKTLDTYEHLAETAIDLEDFEVAEDYLNQVLKGRIKNYGRFNSHVAFSYINLGHLHQKLEKYDEAQNYFHQALGIGQEVYAKTSYDMADIYNYLAKNSDLMCQMDSAKYYYALALAANVPGLQLAIDQPEKSDLTGYLRFAQILESISGMAGLFVTDNTEDLMIATKYILIGRHLIEDLHRNFSNEKDRITMASANKKINRQGLLASFGLFQLTNDPRYLEESFTHSESAKALSLMTAISESQARRKSEISDSVFQVDRKFRKKNDRLRSQLLKLDPQKDKAEYRISKTELFNQKIEQKRFLKELAQQYPRYAALKFGFETKSIREIQDFLSEDQALIEFFLASDSELYAFVMTTDTVRLLNWPLENLGKRTKEFRMAIEQIDQEAYEASAQFLFQQIAQPVIAALPKSIKKLKVIPDGTLSYLPFELLMDDKGMLFERYTISYAASATSYIGSEKGIPGTSKLLALAPVFAEDTVTTVRDLVLREYGSIPGSEEEVKVISKIMGGHSLIGDMATETEFKTNAKDFNILHLATHGVVEPEFADYTRLILRADSLNDGLLHAYELQNLELSAQLAVVSACNSGNGTYAEGEGVLSLSRAFTYAGVPATVASLWPASDKSTPELMKYFYQNLRKGQGKDVALNNARKKYLETATGKARHPFYWGGFVLIGDNSPIGQKPSNLASLLAFLFIITMLPLILVVKKKYLSID